MTENVSELITNIHKENLSSYFVLPLLKMNRDKYMSRENFMGTYLSRDGLSIYVKLYNIDLYEHRMKLHPQYDSVWVGNEDGMVYIQYSIPFKWQPDVQLFLKGMYSRMSKPAMDMIITWSGLQYRKRRTSDGIPVTDLRLMALDRSAGLRDLLSNYYQIEFDVEAELLSIPGERAFIEKSSLTEWKQA